MIDPDVDYYRWFDPEIGRPERIKLQQEVVRAGHTYKVVPADLRIALRTDRISKVPLSGLGEARRRVRATYGC